MTWLQITITALRQHDGQTELRVEADNIEIGRAEVPEQESTNWQNVKVYAASPWHDRIDLNSKLKFTIVMFYFRWLQMFGKAFHVTI